MDDFRCQLGYTLVAEYAMGGGNDRVVELGADGRPRWRIENLEYPVDAVVVADNRVLMVEHNAKHVSERDFKGAILWEKGVPQRPWSLRGPAAGEWQYLYRLASSVTDGGWRR